MSSRVNSKNTILSRRLRQARLLHGLPQDRLGVLAGLEESSSSARISRYESGIHEPPVSFVEAVAAVLEISPAFFYCADDRLAEVILSEGNRLTRDELGEGSSHVHCRFLDPVSWYVHKYDDATGECSLVRGVKPKGSDNGNDPESEEAGRPDDVQLRAITIRRGQGKFREQLLAAYRRTCAISGCKIVDLLEAAHIRPHAEEPNYSVTNGLLLRADLHTLFDLGLLAVDTKRRIRLAPSLLFSEYKIYDGRELRQPEYPSEMPSSEALERRYNAFQKIHCQQSR